MDPRTRPYVSKIVGGLIDKTHLVLLDGVGACKFLMKEGLGSSKVTVEILKRDTANSEEEFVDKIYGKQCVHAFDSSTMIFSSQQKKSERVRTVALHRLRF